MKYLLDTDVLSITSPLSRLGGAEVDAWRTWVQDHADALHFSVVTLVEIRFGLEKLRAKEASRKAAALAKWLLIVETIHRDRIVWVSPEIANAAGILLYKAEQTGMAPGSEDALIAASAQVTGSRLISRNERHMRAFGIDVLNPLRELPA